MLLGGARVSRLPVPGTAVSRTLVRRTHLERHGRTDLRSAIARVSAGGNVGGAKVSRQLELWKLKRSKLFHDCACVVALSSGERISGFIPVREIPTVVCLKTTSVSHKTQKMV